METGFLETRKDDGFWWAIWDIFRTSLTTGLEGEPLASVGALSFGMQDTVRTPKPTTIPTLLTSRDVQMSYAWLINCISATPYKTHETLLRYSNSLFSVYFATLYLSSLRHLI